MAVPLRVLLVEDSEIDAELLLRELRRGGYDPTWERVDMAAALEAALAGQEWDVITCDWMMPNFGAPAALGVLQAHHIEAPVIIVTGELGEELAVVAMKAGAHDVVNKRRLARLVPAIERELREAERRRAHRRAEDALRASEDRYRDLVEHSEDLLCTHDLDGRILSVNAAPARTLGYDQDELRGKNIREILAPEVRDQFADYLATVRQAGVATGLMIVTTKTGERRFWQYRNTLRTAGVPAPIVRGMAHDVTERRRAEEQIRQLNAALARSSAEHNAQLDAARRRLEAYIQAVAGDLRAPLQDVAVCVDRLLAAHAASLDAHGREDLRGVRAAAERMERLLSAWLAGARGQPA